ncbi:MAG: dephospho-CoA kinase [Ghiorsea sp.]|nr:dephospho-CoA kinase [Ghiorsea sp.]
MKHTKFYGLTGGIGAGKSTVAHMFSDLAVPVLDLDKVGHQLLETDKQLQQQLRQTFGEVIMQPDGGIHRQVLAQQAFACATNTNKLNKLLHPRIQHFEKQWRNQQTAPLAMIEASVLIESDGVQRMDGLIVVLAAMDTRRQRVLKRGKQDSVTFESVIQRQCTDKERIKAADFILHNNDDKQTLQTAVEQLYAQLKYNLRHKAGQ